MAGCRGTSTAFRFHTQDVFSSSLHRTGAVALETMGGSRRLSPIGGRCGLDGA